MKAIPSELPPSWLGTVFIPRAFFHLYFSLLQSALFRLGIFLQNNEAFVLEDTCVSVSNMHMPTTLCQCSV